MEEKVREALARGGVIDITTTGRKTGEPRRLEIVLHNIDGRLYISGRPSTRERQWLRNLRADPQFTIHLKRAVRTDLRATARIIAEEPERRAVLARVARNWNVRDIEPMVRYSPLIEVTLEETAA